METFILGNKIEVKDGQHGWAVVKFKGYTMFVNAMVVCEDTPNYCDIIAVSNAISKYAKKVQREITGHEAYDALIEEFGGAKVVCEEIEDERKKAKIDGLRNQIIRVCELCEIDLRMIRKSKRGIGLYVYAKNGKQAFVRPECDYYTLKRMIADLGYPIPYMIKHEYKDGIATGKTTRIDLV